MNTKREKLEQEEVEQDNTDYTNPALLLIDPQEDFCEEDGSLCVPGAKENCQRTADMIDKHGHKFSAIYVTLDTHQQIHIAHPCFWVNDQGKNPQPFTAITVKDVQDGVWKTKDETHQAWALFYVKELEYNKRPLLTIWPYHCLIGSRGIAVEHQVFLSLCRWELKYQKSVQYVSKGENHLTEHYSAIKAEVVVPRFESTDVNQKFVYALKRHSSVVVGGQALSHCVNYTVRDLIELTGKGDSFTLLMDATSPVAGFEGLAKQFLEDMTQKGMQISTTVTLF